MSNSPENPSRRGFFTGSLLTRQGRDQVVKQVKRLGLSPPDLATISSASNCANCEAFCARSCPQEIIKIHPKSHKLMGQPYLDFSSNGCTFCQQCHSACPKTGKQEAVAVSLGKARLNQQNCYAWLNIGCKSCINICPDHLISFDKKDNPTIQLQNCSGCGICIKVCPATAIQVIPQA